MESKQYKLADASSLLGLKAELFRKTESLKSAKSAPQTENLKPTALKVKGEIKPLPKRAPTTAPRKDYDEEDEKLLSKSKSALESKARLYDEIVSKRRNLEHEDCLVDFHKKRIQNDKFKRHHSASGSAETEQDKNYNFVPFSYSEPSGKKEVLPNSSESKEEQEDEGIHYQDVQFNEVRDHGVGYFAFSQDAKKRKEEMDQLNSLHKQTDKGRKLFDEVVEKKRQRLEARLKKIGQRRNISDSIASDYASKKKESADIQTGELTSDTLDEAESLVEQS